MRKRRKKTPEQKLREELWQLCKEITRAYYGDVCYTCSKTGLTGVNWQTGHFRPSGGNGASLRYDLKNLRPQCYNCNMNLGGNGAVFYRKMVEREGQAYVDNLFLEREEVDADKHWLLEKIEEYKVIHNKLFT